MHAAIVMGTRPEVIKHFSTVRALRTAGHRVSVLHTSQHYDAKMRDDVFGELGYAPDHIFPNPYRIGAATDWVRSFIEDARADVVVVNGDTAAALVGTVAALYAGIPLAHVEAGLRSGDPEMIEERNRLMVDACAQELFCYTDHARAVLERTPGLRGVIHVVGNSTLDVIEHFADRFEAEPGRYAFVTLHRRELVDRPHRLRVVLRALEQVARAFDRVVFPVHPRTARILACAGFTPDRGIDVVDPLPPLRALACIRSAALVLTDSGCVQEEACIFDVPCVTIRENTERPETVEVGANVVSGFALADIVAAARAQACKLGTKFPAVYGSPGVGERISAVLEDSVR